VSGTGKLRLRVPSSVARLRLSFFFFKKIDFLVRIEKFRLIEDNVAIIIYIVFL
jgi:hypothetical protein